MKGVRPMKLLPLTYVKDAAKAVKRICKEAFTETQDSVLTKLLGIPELVVTMFCLRREGDEDVLYLWCVLKNDVAMCPHCGAISDTIHEEKPRCIRHLDIWGKKTFLYFNGRRFKCEHCEKPFTEELPFVERNRRMTIVFELHIYESFKSSTIKKVARKEGLNQSTVKLIVNTQAQMKMNRYNGNILTRVLGIDEIALKKRHRQFVLVISDINRKCVLAVLPDRTKETFERWISSLTIQQQKAIRFASMDMWAPYRQAVEKKLPHATIVVDRFHVMKQLNERLSQVRKSLQRRLSETDKKVLKGSRWLLVRNRSDLDSADEEHLCKILNLCCELREIYLLKEEFRRIFDKIRCRQKAERFLFSWKSRALATGDKYLTKFASTLTNWWKEILNYFEERITNGFVEGLNNGIRGIIRRAFGFRNFSNFCYQVHSEFGLSH